MNHKQIKKILLFIMLILGSFTAFGANNYTFSRGILTSEVVSREPGTYKDNFPLHSKAYYFTEFKDISEKKVIKHNWYFIDSQNNKKLMATVSLPIQGKRWRTWSSKNLFLKGEWLVEVVDDQNHIISTESFTVK